ncbi:DUF6415 family natural product biosynthesis protein [Streptomyces sp. NPDC057540]|uniref:DUF6415 family natural product biosynthesis protein n=1 Tax=Streptomyces sp. NPDC057540 TaxID=3346160 RepID=UPI0036C1E2EE
MREPREYPEQADGPTIVDVDLGAFLRQAADPIEEYAEEVALLLVNRVLAFYGKPENTELAAMTDALLTHCANLATGVETIPERQRPTRGQGALRDWAQLQQDGPGDGPLGSWSYARQLALVARNMVTALRENRTAGRQPFVGRSEAPPLAPSAP